MTRSERFLIGLVILAVPFFGFSFLNVRGLPFGRPDIIASELLVAAFSYGLFFGRKAIASTPTTVAVAGLLLVAFLSLVNVFRFSDFSTADYSTVMAQLLMGAAVFVVMSNTDMKWENLRGLLRFWILVPSLVAGYAIYQIFARNLGLPLGYLDLSNPGLPGFTTSGEVVTYTRVSSVLFEPSRLGLYLGAPTAVMGVALFYGQAQEIFFRRPLLNHVAFGTIVIGLAATISIGAYISIAIASLVFALRAQYILTRLIRFTGVILIILAVWLVVSAAVGVGSVEGLGRVTRVIDGALPSGPNTTFDRSSFERAGRLWIGLSIFSDNPALGVGLNQIQFVGQQYRYPEWARQTDARPDIQATGFILVQASIAMGIPGLLAMAWVCGSMALRLENARRRSRDPHHRVLMLGFFIALVSLVFDASLVIGQPIFWTTLGLAAMAARQATRADRPLADELRAPGLRPAQMRA